MPYRESRRLVGVQAKAHAQGMRVEKIVLMPNRVTRYAIFREGSLAHALSAVFWNRLVDLDAALTPVLGRDDTPDPQRGDSVLQEFLPGFDV